MLKENGNSNHLLFSLIRKTFIYTCICFLFSNRIFWNYLKRNNNLLENDFKYVNKTYDNKKDDSSEDDIPEINYISFESIKKFEKITNPEEYTIMNLKRAISDESLKDIFNYHQDYVKKKEKLNKHEFSDLKK